MELRRLSVWTALILLGYLSHCSEARHSLVRRDADDSNYDDFLGDEASDDEAQNDAEGNDVDEDIVMDAKILSEPTDYTVALGGSLRLECRVSPAEGVVVQWKRNNTSYYLGTMAVTEQELKAYGVEDRFSIASNSTDLLIRDVRPSDSGEYSCEILQPDKPIVKHRVSVLESPRIIKFTATDNGELVEGSDLLLTCEVAGSPPPQIVWSRAAKMGNERLEEKDGEFSLHTVFIKNVKREHSGKYYCYAFNTIGSNQAEVKVVVKGKPRVHVHRTVINSALNVEAVLQCSVHDESATHIRWYKDGKRIEDTSRLYTVSTQGQHSDLSVTPISDEDFGTFTCEAENEFGSHNRSIDLVQRPVVENLNADGPKLTWTIHSHQPLQQIEIQLRDVTGEGDLRTINVPVPETLGHEYPIIYTLENDQLDSGKYEATVKVKNEKSWSDHSESALVDIEAQPQLIQHASVYRSNANRMPSRPTLFAFTTTLFYLLVRM